MEEGVKAKRGIRWTTCSTIVKVISQILKITILTRILAKEDFGLVALVTVVLGFCNLFADLGFSTGILHKQNISKKEYSSLYWTSFLFSILIYIGIIAFSPLIADFYDQPEISSIIPIICINVVVACVGRQFGTFFYKDLEFKIPSIIEITSELGSLLLAILLALKGFGVYSLVYSVVFKCVLCNIMLFILGIKKYPLSFVCSFKSIIPFIKIGIYQVGAQSVNYFSRDFDVLIIGKMLGATELGVYSLAKQLVGRPYNLINPIINKVATPYLAKFQGCLETLRTQYYKSVSLVSGMNILVYFLLCIFAYPVVYVLYGESFLDATIIVQVLCLFMLERAIGNPLGSLMAATGKTNLDFMWNVVYAIVVPFFIFAGISFHSSLMVAVFLDICSIILFYPNWRFVIKPIVGGTFKEYLMAVFNLKGFYHYSRQEISSYIHRVK